MPAGRATGRRVRAGMCDKKETGMEETPLRDRPSLHDELVSALRNMIVAGDLGAGDWIAEPALCRHLGVSRTPLREALKVLAFDGWVELVPNRGAAVTRT